MNDEGIDRRAVLSAGAAGLAGVALAGCVEGEMEDDGSPNGTDGSADLERPVPPASPDDEYWQFVIDSLDYQNRALEEMQ